MRLRVIALAPGELKLVVSFAPMLKLFQLIMALPDVCVMVVVFPDELIVALPEATEPSVGLARRVVGIEIATKRKTTVLFRKVIIGWRPGPGITFRWLFSPLTIYCSHPCSAKKDIGNIFFVYIALTK
jgi:hypothetical protein